MAVKLNISWELSRWDEGNGMAGRRVDKYVEEERTLTILIAEAGTTSAHLNQQKIGNRMYHLKRHKVMSLWPCI